MNEQPEFTVDEALQIADQNAEAYKGVRSVSRTLAAEARRGRALAAAVLAYDSAIKECGNDPARMASHCTAEGDDLDALYMRWLTLAQQMVAP